MGTEIRDWAPASIQESPGGEPEPGLGVCALHELARVLGLLLHKEVPAQQAQEKAVAFGLLRLPAGGERITLSPQAASRLLLAAYGCPAYFSIANLPELYRSVRAGHLVFAALAQPPFGPSLLQVRGVHREAGSPTELFLTELGSFSQEARRLSQETFVRAWAAAGNGLLVAARRWSDLPAEGTVFFGGSRGADGSYHWDTAECDTDRAGRILRF